MSQNQVEEAKKFIAAAEAKLLDVGVEASRADWVKDTYITEDTELLAAKADERAINAAVELAKQATRFDHVKLPEDVARKLKLLKLSLTLATPSDPKESAELTEIVSSMEGTYGKGKWCPPGKDKCLDIEDITRVMANSRDANELRDAWVGWHGISRPMRKDFVRYVELANKGARELGFQDNGAMWRSKYDMTPDEFARELDRLWEQVRPLYVALHAYVRNRLREKYGDAVVPASGPIPAHLLGNLWAQEWGNIYPLVAPQNADPGYDLTKILKGRNTGRQANGALRRTLLHIFGLCTPAGHFLAAIAFREAPGPRRGLPRQRLGRGLRERLARQDVHRYHGRILLDHPPRARPQLLPASL